MMMWIFVFSLLAWRAVGMGRPPLVDRRGMLLGGAATSVLASPGIAAAQADVFEVGPGSLEGRTILITGANSGLGLESAVRLAGGGAEIIATARSEEKAQYSVETIRSGVPGAKVKSAVLDLASLESVGTLPQRLKSVSKIDVLLNNAGQMAVPEERKTSNGFERQIGVNMLGHFALTAAVLPMLNKRGARVINVSSAAHLGAQRKDLEDALTSNTFAPLQYSQWGNYCLSKAMNILFSLELQRRFTAANYQMSAVSLHPGVVATDLGRYLVGGSDAQGTSAINLTQKQRDQAATVQKLVSFFGVLPVEKGANTQVFLAAAADSVSHDLTANGGLYFDKMRSTQTSALCQDTELAKQLFVAAEGATGVLFDV